MAVVLRIETRGTSYSSLPLSTEKCEKANCSWKRTNGRIRANIQTRVNKKTHKQTHSRIDRHTNTYTQMETHKQTRAERRIIGTPGLRINLSTPTPILRLIKRRKRQNLQFGVENTSVSPFCEQNGILKSFSSLDLDCQKYFFLGCPFSMLSELRAVNSQFPPTLQG